MAKYNLPLKSVSTIYHPPPPNNKVQFTTQITKSDLSLKLVSMIYPSNGQIQFTPQSGEYDLPPPPQITKV